MRNRSSPDSKMNQLSFLPKFVSFTPFRKQFSSFVGIIYSRTSKSSDLTWNLGTMLSRYGLLRGLRAFHIRSNMGARASDLTAENSLLKDHVGCPICSRNVSFTHKDVLFLAQFLSPEGNLLNRRLTGVCKKQQIKLQKAVKISRRLGLLPKCGPVNPIEASSN